MLLVKPFAEIMHITTEPLHLIEAAGRTCYKSESKMDGTMENAEKFSAMILKRGHESVIEHCSATVRFVCDRGVSHEIVRHRLASYSQESTRYCDYEGGHVAFVIPTWVDVVPGVLAEPIPFAAHDEGSRYWLGAMMQAEEFYRVLRREGWRPEQARSVLPNSLKTEIVMTANLREWRHFFKLRTAPAAHPQMREVAIPLLEEMKQKVQVIFDDILPSSEIVS